jgi:hypothetical protein
MAEEPRQGLLGARGRQPVMPDLLIVRCDQISRQRLCCQQQAGAGNGVVHKGHQAGGMGDPRAWPTSEHYVARSVAELESVGERRASFGALQRLLPAVARRARIEHYARETSAA